MELTSTQDINDLLEMDYNLSKSKGVKLIGN